MFGRRRREPKPCTVVIVQGRDIWLRANATEVRMLLAEAESTNEPVRFPLYNGDGDVLIDAGFVGAIFVPSDHQPWRE